MMQHGFTPRPETLDDRALMSVTLTAAGVLHVTGSSAADVISVTLESPTQLQVTDATTGEKERFDLSRITRILIRSRAGDDTVVIGSNITVPAEVRAWTGNDTIQGGGGNDILDGGDGNDTIQGGAGNDNCKGGLGNNKVDGGTGTNISDGGGTNRDDKFPRTFEVEVHNLTPNVTATVYVNGTPVGTMWIGPSGDGKLKYDTRLNNFPADFPPIHPGSVTTIQIKGVTVALGTV